LKVLIGVDTGPGLTNRLIVFDFSYSVNPNNELKVEFPVKSLKKLANISIAAFPALATCSTEVLEDSLKK